MEMVLLHTGLSGSPPSPQQTVQGSLISDSNTSSLSNQPQLSTVLEMHTKKKVECSARKVRKSCEDIMFWSLRSNTHFENRGPSDIALAGYNHMDAKCNEVLAQPNVRGLPDDDISPRLLHQRLQVPVRMQHHLRMRFLQEVPPPVTNIRLLC